MLNEALNRRKPQNTFTETFSINNEGIFNPMLTANYFCKYFSGIGLKLAEKIPFPTQSHQSYLHGNYSNSLSFKPVSEDEIISILGSLHTGTSSGYDNICI